MHQKCIKSASKKENASFTNISKILLTLVNFTNISKILRKIRLVKPVFYVKIWLSKITSFRDLGSLCQDISVCNLDVLFILVDCLH